jgi:hypothetical protein
VLAIACGAFLAASCDHAPNKEIDQAEGAFDAARATGSRRGRCC